ncbi:hypothetical protein D9M68_861270 [compost metagenome]
MDVLAVLGVEEIKMAESVAGANQAPGRVGYRGAIGEFTEGIRQGLEAGYSIASQRLLVDRADFT